VFTFSVSRSMTVHRSPFTFHGLYGLALAVILLAGCATSLKREGQCLASLTPDYLHAQEELASLEASWHRSLARRDAELNGTRPWLLTSTAFRHDQSLSPPPGAPAPAHYDPAGGDSREAYRRLIEARSRHRPLLVWYDKVYERVRTRTDEEEILSDVRLLLITGPGVVFYPLIRWNIHSVFWDVTDPDAESDPVTRYCAARLTQVAVLVEAAPGAAP
jgi:hypothetical protein